MLRARSAAEPERTAYTFLSLVEPRETRLTYGELDRRARATAVLLREAGVAAAAGRPPDATVLLVFPAGFDFIASFFGCLYAGSIAVPTRYPNAKRPFDHLKSVAADSGAAIGLTTPEMRPLLAERVPAVQWLTPADIDPGRAGEYAGFDPDAEDIAYLQYTSGSTASPKGVIVQHAHIVANSQDFSVQFEVGPESRTMSWLPHYHDLGLVFGCFQPLFVGCAAFLMSPTTFAQRPLTWLEVVSSHRITHTAAPNFAYQSCLDIPAEQRGGLDLRSVRVFLNGAEPVRADTVEAFVRLFAPQGVTAEAMCPAYGLAEVTLLATSPIIAKPPTILTIRAESQAGGAFVPVDVPMEGGQPGRRLVASGTIDGGTRVVIADPETGRGLETGRFGEVWLAGPSVAGGYWRRPEASAAKFAARLADSGAGPFLRTGDLGAVFNGELFVLGRMDDLMIIHGANYSPEDLELTVEECDPALQPGGGAAFTVEVAGEPRLIIAQEIKRTALRGLDADRTVKAILRAVSEHHDLEVSAVVLLKPRGLPKTHSGKKQRHACRRDFRSGSFQDVKTWIAPRLQEALASAEDRQAESPPMPPVIQAPPPDGRAAEIAGWLKGWIAREFRRDQDGIAATDRFSEFGMGSVTAMMLTGALGQWLGVELSPTLLWDHPTIGDLSAHLSKQMAAPERNELSLLARIDELSEEELASLVAEYSEAG
jgi:acyl-CoA synthetase (AMP-forming)/AMP-acid ligase II/acyl carrier protein